MYTGSILGYAQSFWWLATGCTCYTDSFVFIPVCRMMMPKNVEGGDSEGYILYSGVLWCQICMRPNDSLIPVVYILSLSFEFNYNNINSG